MRCWRICMARSGCCTKASSPAEDRLRPSELSVALSRRHASRRTLVVYVRRGSGALAGRPLVGARRSHANAVRAGLCAGESARSSRACFPTCSTTSTCVRVTRRVLRQLRDAFARQSSRRRDAAGGGADARPIQRNLLRARLSRAPVRLAAGRRQRAHRARRHGVPENARAACGACTRSCAGSTTTSAIRWSCAPTRRWACLGLSEPCAQGASCSANALGSGVIESAAWLGFLPSDLRVAARRDVAACRRSRRGGAGNGRRSEEVLEGLDRLVIKPTFPNQKFEPVFGRDLDATTRAPS